jgi:hypothetical protein
MPHEVVILEIAYGEYRATYDCCKTFRSSPPGVDPRCLYDNQVRDAVLDRLIEDASFCWPSITGERPKPTPPTPNQTAHPSTRSIRNPTAKPLETSNHGRLGREASFFVDWLSESSSTTDRRGRLKTVRFDKTVQPLFLAWARMRRLTATPTACAPTPMALNNQISH